MRCHALVPAGLLVALITIHALADDEKYPLGPQLRVLAGDVKSEKYRELVLHKMLVTDLAAEWTRVETEDNPDSFLKKHGGKDRVLADPELKMAYERRVAIRNQFLDLMREGYKKYKEAPPFDKGAKAEAAGTLTKNLGGAKASLGIVPPVAGAERQWPRFRGPSGQGLTGLASLPTKWDKDGAGIVWRTKTPGLGNSSPIVWGDRIFLTSADAKGAERFVHCFQRSDGQLLWSRQAPAKPPEPGVRDKNGYASATPVTDGERVIVFLGSCGVLCYDFHGKLLWQHELPSVKTTHGTGSSPLLYRDLVIFMHDQNIAESICLALDKHTGKIRWQQSRDKAMTWSTPVIVRVGDHDELVFAGGETVKGYDPLTGRELWMLKGPTAEVVPTIVIGKDLIYSASGRSGPTLGIRPGGRGDVTDTHLAWRTVRGGPHVPSPMLTGNRLFTVNDHGIATCLNAETGELVWQDRIHDRFSASPIEAGGILYFPSESGVTYLLKPGDQFEIIAKNDLGAPILASFAVAGGRLIIRTQEELICIGAASAR